MELWTAFTIGLFGSLHCVGMCGPIALALPYQASTHIGTALNASIYNVGRAIGYGLIGILPGLLGKGLFIAGFQKNMSIGLGIFLVLAALFSFSLESKILAIPIFKRFNGWLQRQLGFLLKKRNQPTFFGIGFLNAFLPCGLVYVALAGAVTQSTIVGGMQYMILFGLGTIPLMLVMALAGQLINMRWRKYFRRLVPVFMLLFAMLFIFRGLNIDLPLDLRLWVEQGAELICH